MELRYEIAGGDFTAAGNCSSEVKMALKKLGVSPEIIKKAIISLYEAEVNIVAHAYNGIALVDITTDRILCNLKDEGPGIEKIDLAMKPGWSTASQRVREMGFGAGMGLPNILKNCDKFKISSEVGVGTIVEFEVIIK